MMMKQTDFLVRPVAGEAKHTRKALQEHINIQVERGWEMVLYSTNLWTDNGANCVLHNFIWRREPKTIVNIDSERVN